MAGLNKVILIGHLGRDPETTVYEGNVKRVTFTVATSESYKDKAGNKVTQTEWHNIVCWRGLADVASQYLKKGMQVYLEGKIRTHSWEDNGVKKYATDIIADTFQMLGAKANNEGAQEQPIQPFPTQDQSSAPTNAPTIESAEDDLPF
ncbi:MAG: single-stranded DNA-binding protein [Bacteroidota bacterium]